LEPPNAKKVVYWRINVVMVTSIPVRLIEDSVTAVMRNTRNRGMLVARDWVIKNR
jgi:hypothetical protein